MLEKDRIKTLLSIVWESNEYKKLNLLEQKDLTKAIESSSITCLDMLKNFKIYEILLSGCKEDVEGVVNYLKNELNTMLNSKDKYNLDLALGFIYNMKYEVSEEQKEVFAKNISNLSLVAKELLFDIDKIEIKSMEEANRFDKDFNIKKVIEEAKIISDKTKKQ